MNTKAELLRLSAGSLHESAEDFTLPDYLPEIRRIISCTGTVLPESRYVDRGEVVLSGLIVANVCYVGADGTLCAFPMNSEYTGRVSLTGHDTAAISADSMAVRTCLESISARATGPRRMSLTARMRSGIISSGEGELTFELYGSDGSDCTVSDEMSLEKRTFQAEYTKVSCLSGTGSISGDLREREGVEIISCEGVCSVNSASADPAGATVRGDVYVKCLACDGEGVYFTTGTKLPFEERLEVTERLESDSVCYAVGKARCAAIKLQGGEGGVFSIEAEYDAEAILCADRMATLIDDAYSTAFEGALTRSSAPIVRCLTATNSRLSVNASKQVTRESGKETVYTAAKVTVDRTEYTPDGKLIVHGGCNVNVVLADDGGVTAEEMTVPYRYECDCKKSGNSTPLITCDVSVISADSVLDGDKLSANCELNFSILVLGCTDTPYVSRMTIDRDVPVGIDRSTVKLYFPYESESMWDIGKRYHCEQKCIKKTDNENCVIISL